MSVPSVLGWIVIVTLSWAGAAKLLNPAATLGGIRSTLRAVPIPRWSVWFLVAAELGISAALAFGLLSGSFVQPPALGAGILLALFTVINAVDMIQGGESSCACFGATDIYPIRFKSFALARSAFLSSLAFVLAVAPPGQTSAVEETKAAILAVSIVAMAAVILRAVQSVRLWPAHTVKVKEVVEEVLAV